MTETAKLYVILGSHACRAGKLLLEHAGVPYREVEIPTGFQPPLLRARRFPGGTVPALSHNGHRIQTNREIARFLDQTHPGLELYPNGTRSRARVEEAERFADERLQTIARRLVLQAGARDLASLVDHADSGRLGPILARSRRRRARIMRLATSRFFFDLDEHTEQLDLTTLPRVLDQVDAWVECGLLNGDELNAADFQMAPSLCLLTYRAELREEVESRPAWRLAERLLPERLTAPVGG